MIKYELMEETAEVQDYKNMIQGCVACGTRDNTKLLKQFDDKDEALSALKKHHTDVHFLGYSPAHHPLWWVTEYWVQEVEYDDEDEDDFGNMTGIWAITEMPTITADPEDEEEEEEDEF